jgi:putative redox protein
LKLDINREQTLNTGVFTAHVAILRTTLSEFMNANESKVHVAWQGDRRYEVSRPGAKSITIDGNRLAGPGPVETLLGSLAACSAIDVIDYLEKRRTPATRLEVAVAGVRNATPPRRVLTALLEFQIDGEGIDADHAERSITLAFATYCSVAATLAPDVALSTRLVLNGVTRADVVQRPKP